MNNDEMIDYIHNYMIKVSDMSEINNYYELKSCDEKELINMYNTIKIIKYITMEDNENNN